MMRARCWTREVAFLAVLWSGCGEPILEAPPDGVSPDDGGLDGTCVDDGARRRPNPPKRGDVQITEWMANPSGRDTEQEWVEVWFREAADLKGFELGATTDSLEPVVEGEECFPIDAGTWVVFGASSAAAPRVDAELRLNLGNSGVRSIVAATGGVVLDRVDYEGAVEGVATQIDEDGNRCEARATDVYGDGNAGTPGSPNTPCPVELAPGECFGVDGSPRRIAPPQPGTATISEWLADPAAVDNRKGEWVEIRFSAAADANGLTLSDRSASTTLDSEDCIEVVAGSHLVFARDLDSSENGGLSAVPLPLSLSLNNREETLTLSVNAIELDVVSYASSEPGVAIQVDDLGRVCAATEPFGLGDLGTPGLANPPCP